MSNVKKLKTVDQAYQELLEAFGEEALSTDNSRGFDLTSVKAQYIVERLNNVCGVNGWRLEGSWQPQEEGGVLYLGRLSIFFDRFCERPEGFTDTLNHYVETVGFSVDKKNLGDAYKGARTDALSKGAATLGVANEVFKGNVKPPSKTKPAVKAVASPAVAAKPADVKKPASFANKPSSVNNSNGF